MDITEIKKLIKRVKLHNTSMEYILLVKVKLSLFFTIKMHLLLN
jgi:hypothetical protein